MYEAGLVFYTQAVICVLASLMIVGAYKLYKLPRRGRRSLLVLAPTALMIVFNQHLPAQQSFDFPSFRPSPSSAGAEQEFCGHPTLVGPSFVEEFNRLERQRAQFGFIFICEPIVGSFFMARRVKSWHSVLPELGFIPVNLDGTPFASFELMGGVLNATLPSLISLKKTDHVARVFRRPDGLTLFLEEHDLSITGGGVTMVYREPDVMINSAPGFWTIGQAKSGNAYSELWWQGETREFKLVANANLRRLDGGEAYFLDLARSLPAGIPSGKHKTSKFVVGKPGEISNVEFQTAPEKW